MINGWKKREKGGTGGGGNESNTFFAIACGKCRGSGGVGGEIYIGKAGTDIKGADNDLKLSIQLFIRGAVAAQFYFNAGRLDGASETPVAQRTAPSLLHRPALARLPPRRSLYPAHAFTQRGIKFIVPAQFQANWFTPR